MADHRKMGIGLDEILLGSVLLLFLGGAGLAVGLYVLPREPLVIPELQPAVRIAREEGFPVGSHRVTNWGERIVLVVRREERDYFALEGESPIDGCILSWDPESLSVVSPCAHVVYDRHGNAVGGLTTEPLRRYAAFVRDGTVYVTESAR